MADEPPARLFRFEYRDGTSNNLLPAELGTWSLEGLSHTTTLIAHFMLEGRIKRRAPYSDQFRIVIGPPTTGSWVVDFYILASNPLVWTGVVGSLGGGAATLTKMLNRVVSRATGEMPANDDTSVFEDEYSGTFDALVEAVEPSLIRAHRVIASENRSIRLVSRYPDIELNRETKAYVESSELDTAVSSAIGNVAAYNVNNRTGRLYLDDLGRTVPFLLHRDADQNSAVALATSLQNYASFRLSNHSIRISYLATRSVDGRIKRILIIDATYLFVT